MVGWVDGRSEQGRRPSPRACRGTFKRPSRGLRRPTAPPQRGETTGRQRRSGRPRCSGRTAALQVDPVAPCTPPFRSQSTRRPSKNLPRGARGAGASRVVAGGAGLAGARSSGGRRACEARRCRRSAADAPVAGGARDGPAVRAGPLRCRSIRSRQTPHHFAVRPLARSVRPARARRGGRSRSRPRRAARAGRPRSGRRRSSTRRRRPSRGPRRRARRRRAGGRP